MATNYKASAKTAAIKRDKSFAKNNRGLAELRAFVRSFERFPTDLRREMRIMLIASVQAPFRQAQSNASWSSRIPGAMRIRTNFTKRSAGVGIELNRNKAPHGRAYEGLGRRMIIRHPTGTPREPWVTQATRPSIWPAVQPWQQRIDGELIRVVDSTARKHGFR